MLDNFKRCK